VQPSLGGWIRAGGLWEPACPFAGNDIAAAMGFAGEEEGGETPMAEQVRIVL
jgi:hypothetical protein